MSRCLVQKYREIRQEFHGVLSHYAPHVIKTARILVLGNNEPMRVLLASVLQDKGFDVVAAARGDEAVEIASRKFNLVIFDVEGSSEESCEEFMTGLGCPLQGTAFLFLLQNDPLSEVSSNGSPRLGAVRFLRKPFELSPLLEEIGLLLKVISPSSTVNGRKKASGASVVGTAQAQKVTPKAEFQSLQEVDSESDNTPALPLLRLRLMGNCQATVGEHSLDDKVWLTKKAKYLFFCLAASRKPVPVSELIEEFWPGASRSGLTSLWKAMSAVRKVFKPFYPGLEPIVRLHDNLQVNPKLPLWLDCFEVERLWKDYLVKPTLELLVALKELCNGSFLPQCLMDWAYFKRTRLDHICSQALSRLTQLQANRKNWMQVIETALLGQTFDPCNEMLCRAVLQAQLALHQPISARRTFEQFVDNLQRKLDLEPSPAFCQAYKEAMASSL